MASRERFEREMREELETHVSTRTDALMAQGLKPDEARRQARLEFGSMENYKEACRESGRARWIDDFRQDIVYACRSFVRTPVFTTAAILTLALGIGGNAAIFSVVNAVLIRPLPYEQSDRIGFIAIPVPDRLGAIASIMSVGELPDWRENTTTLQDISAYADREMVLAADEPARLTGMLVSGSLFSLLGVEPALGRDFQPNEDLASAQPVAIISHALWQRHFGGDSQVIGRSVNLDDKPVTVVGVMPATFRFPTAATEIWVPWVVTNPDSPAFPLVRIADGVSVEAATDEVNAIYERRRAERQPGRTLPEESKNLLRFISLKERTTAPVRTALLVLLSAVGVVLLIACCNVANLATARAANRRQELAVRVALGAGRSRLTRQFLSESLVLSTVGGALGLFVGYGSLGPLQTAVLGDVPRFDEVRMDTTILVSTVMVSVFAGLFAGLVPAITAPQRAVQRVSAGLGHRAFERQRSRSQAFLIVLEVSFTTVLLVAAGLLVRGYLNASSRDLGFVPQNVLTFNVPMPRSYSDSTATELNISLLSRLEQVPGVLAATMTDSLPLSPMGFGGPARSPDLTEPFSVRVHTSTHKYVETFGLTMVAGRTLRQGDQAGAPRVAVVNRTFAQQFGGDAIGKTFELTSGPFASSWEIVGVVDNVQPFRLDMESVREAYVDVRQWPTGGLMISRTRQPNFGLRTAGDPTALVSTIRGIVSQLDPRLVLGQTTTLQERVTVLSSPHRLNAMRLGLFAALGVLLTLVGIFGLVSYAVAQRTYEIGVRIALGARPFDVLRTVVGKGVLLALGGIGIGLALAAALTRYMESMLFGVTPLDPQTFALVAIGLAVVTAFASYIPARRAVRVDPIIALKCE